jgi:hypothetical protein
MCELAMPLASAVLATMAGAGPARPGRPAAGPRAATPAHHDEERASCVQHRWNRPAGWPFRAHPWPLQPPWTTIARRGDTFEPIGFGPVAAF